MSDLVIQSNVLPAQPLTGLPELPGVTIRPGVMSDVPFLDSLQKLHTKQVGWMPTKQFEGKIKLGHVLIAEANGQAVGYCIGNDQYFKRDDVGIIYQLNVLPGRQRGLIGALLLKAQFERSAWGCKLYCCWCAQDIAANHFWEAMGFVPLAFRAGSEKRSRIHIFWQKRIRAGDTTTAWWFPAQTSGGSIREDRIVLPILPGTHWSDAKPLVLPNGDGQKLLQAEGEPAPSACERTPRERKPREKRALTALPGAATKTKQATIAAGGLRFSPAKPVEEAKATEKRPREKRVKQKNDPRLVAAAREMRDRWLERVNTTPLLDSAKYDVTRAISDEGRVEIEAVRRLTAA